MSFRTGSGRFIQNFKTCVRSLVNNTILFTSTTGTWIANNTNIAIGPLDVFDSESNYLSLDSYLNVLGLVDSVGFTPIPGNSLTPTVQFGALLDNGRVPDEILVEGTSIEVEVQVTNTEGQSDLLSNPVTPGSTTTLFANNPADVAVFNQIKAAFQAY